MSDDNHTDMINNRIPWGQSYCHEEIDRKRMEHHMYSKHKDVKLHICDQCPFKTNSLTNLTRHIDNMHLAIKYSYNLLLLQLHIQGKQNFLGGYWISGGLKGILGRFFGCRGQNSTGRLMQILILEKRQKQSKNK